jgi:DNA polymerase I-like protein with 3'-5' exonuclease and polymerase domains
VQEFLDNIKDATWVFHNSVFDLGHLRRWATVEERKNMRDILLIERIMWSNYYDDFTLAALVRRYLKCYMTKVIRKEFHGLEGRMSNEQIEYAALDVVGTWKVDVEQQKLVTKRDIQIWNGMYNPHVWTTLELGGFKLDVAGWKALAEENQKIVDEISAELGKLYGHKETKLVGRGKNRHEEEYFVPFNPNSPAQVKEILRREYGLELESTDDDHLTPYANSIPFAKRVLDFRYAGKQASTYGMSFLDNVEQDGRIYTSLNIGLAESGRDSSSSPNLQNIPKEKRRRKLFIAGDGRYLCLYDYSGQEAGTWAFITGDEKFKEIINSGKKLYIEVARIAFNEEVTKGTKRYDLIKSLVLMLMYGGTAWGFARDNKDELDHYIAQNLSEKEKMQSRVKIAQEMVDKFMDGFPTSAKWIRDQQARNRGVATTIMGRRGYLHPYDRQWKNNALNTPNQGSGGDMIKLAMKMLRRTDFYKKYYPLGKVQLLLQVHDEIVSEVDSDIAEEWSSIMRTTMIDVAEAMTPGVRANVSGGLIHDWSQKD